MKSPITNAFTCDVEDYFQVSALAPHFPRGQWDSVPCRIERNVDRVLELLDGHGAWSGKSERVIMCAVKPGQLGPLRRMVREIDPKSFLIVGDARTIYGHGVESIEED